MRDAKEAPAKALFTRLGSTSAGITRQPCAAASVGYIRNGVAHGQKRAYLKAQLDAFASGSRHNDINQQMREIARALSAAERDALADWYGEVRHPN